MIQKVLQFILLVVAICFFENQAVAQCDQCKNAEGNMGDYCHSSPAFTGYCSCFYADKNEVMVHFSGGKKPVAHTFSLPAEGETAVAWLVKLSEDKKNKMTVKEALFLEQALPEWAKAKMTIGMTATASGLKYKIIQEGTGKLPEAGKNVSVHYRGTLPDGTEFDNSYKRGEPISFPLGKNRVIKGWDEGIALLKVGSKAIFCIPPGLAYGPRGNPPLIPPDATLFFEVELVKAD